MPDLTPIPKLQIDGVPEQLADWEAEQKRKRARTTVGAVAQKEKRRKRIQTDGVDLLPEDELADVFEA